MSDAWGIEYGDRRNELVFIGIDIDEAEIIKILDRCLLTAVELEGDKTALEDPYPWVIEQQA